MICNLKSFRDRKHLSQEELGAEINATREEVSLWEKGHRVPYPKRRREIAAYFQCDPNDIWPVEPAKEAK